jgi:hypothetical protein
MGNPINQSAYLRTSRLFPSDDVKLLSIEIDRGYRDIANCVNSRAIGLFSVSEPAISGKQYFVSSKPFSSLQKLFAFTSTSAINHGISNLTPGQVVTAYGSYTNGSNDFGFIYNSGGTISTDITFKITPTQIVFTVGGSAPTLTSGKIIIEYLAYT